MDTPWLDPSLPVAERAASLLAAMTTAEKVGQLHQAMTVTAETHADEIRTGAVGSSVVASGSTAGNVRDDGLAARGVNAVQRIAVEESRLGIPVLFARDVIHGHRTVLPIPLGQAASWDADLVERGARMAAVEASAVGIGWTFTPMMDISGDHRWGRVAESLGEDPVLAGRLAAAIVRGFQGDDLAAPDSLAACAKHFVGYGLAEGGRDYNTVTAGENSLRNLQLRPFRDAVDAGVATVMAAFNDVDGVPMHANRHYLRSILKDEWGFDGTVVSDWDGLGELVQHRVAADLADAARQGLEAGVDIGMVSRAFADHLEPVDDQLLDDAVRRVLELKLRCGLFEHPYVDETLEARVSATPGHRAVSRTAAAASLVLLTNDGILPLEPARTGKVLMTGPLYDAALPLLGTWTLDGRAEEVVTVAAGMAGRFTDGTEVDAVPWTHTDEVLYRARLAGTVIAFVGEHPCRSGEANSVSALDLPPGQLDTLTAIKALGTQLVVVVFAGRALDLRWVAEHADAVLWAWHPGSEGGHAVADVLFGAVGPQGRLPVTFPRSTGQVPLVYNHRSTGRPIPAEEETRRGRYQDTLATPLFPFGHGLTYGEVTYGDVTVGEAEEEALTVTATVTNVGERACTEVVQCYVRDDVAEITRPVRELYDFAHVTLAPGESRTVSFTLEAGRLGYYGRDNTYRTDPGTFTVWIAPNAAAGTPVTVLVAD